MMDWLDLLALQQTLKSLLQHHSSKASILRCLAFETSVQLSHWCTANGKTKALTRQTLNLQGGNSPRRTHASSWAPRPRACVPPGPGLQRCWPKDALQESLSTASPHSPRSPWACFQESFSGKLLFLSPMDLAQPRKGTPTCQPSEQGRYESGPKSRGRCVQGGQWVSQTHRWGLPFQSAQ